MLPLAVVTRKPIKVSHYPLASACSQSQSSIFTSVQWAYERMEASVVLPQLLLPS